jgi:2-oxoglutarate ferredoxin oxidoreductase subunit beta
MSTAFDTYETAWCPGCGNFAILECLKTALEELGKEPSAVLLAAGIGQAAKIPQYISANAFCGLHGRGLPPAVAAKIANEKLTVIVSTGDGDTYGEGGNHFIHNVRRNVDIAHFVHDNQVYGLTKGQASPTSGIGMVTGVQTDGNINEPLNPVLLAIAAGAGFVARAFTGHKKQLISLMKQAIEYKGYALIDILQPCVSFNKINTFAWYNQRVYELEESYDPGDKAAAMIKAMEFGDRIPLGLLYHVEKQTYHQKNEVLKQAVPLLDRKTELDYVNRLIASYI